MLKKFASYSGIRAPLFTLQGFSFPFFFLSVTRAFKNVCMGQKDLTQHVATVSVHATCQIGHLCSSVSKLLSGLLHQML